MIQLCVGAKGIGAPRGQEVRQPTAGEMRYGTEDYKLLSRLTLMQLLRKVRRHRSGLLPRVLCCGTPTTRMQDLALFTSEIDS